MFWMRNKKNKYSVTHFAIRIKRMLTLKAPIATKVVCFSCLLKCLRSFYDKQCGPRSDCSYREQSDLGPNCLLQNLQFVSNVRQLFAAEDFSIRHFSDAFFLGALGVNSFGMVSELL